MTSLRQVRLESPPRDASKWIVGVIGNLYDWTEEVRRLFRPQLKQQVKSFRATSGRLPIVVELDDARPPAGAILLDIRRADDVVETTLARVISGWTWSADVRGPRLTVQGISGMTAGAMYDVKILLVWSD